MLTSEQAGQYIGDMFGVAAPSFIVDAAVETAVSREALLVSTGYSAARITLMQSMLVALLVLSQAPRAISSQSAPSGASRSFFRDEKALDKLRAALRGVDTEGVLADLVPFGPRPFIIAV